MATKNDLQRDLGNLKDDVEKLRSHTADLVSKLAETGKDTVDSAVCNTKKAARDVEKTFRKNPVLTVAGAVGLGALFGSILKRMFCGKRR